MRTLLLQFECRPAFGGYRFVAFDPSKFEDHHFKRSFDLSKSFEEQRSRAWAPPENATEDERYLLKELGSPWRDAPHPMLTQFLLPNSERTKRFDLFTTDPAAFLKLACMPITPEAAIAFANRFGCLFGGVVVESFNDWKVAVQEMRQGVSAWEHANKTGDFKKLSQLFEEKPISRESLDVFLSNVRTGAPQISLRPGYLGSALMVQLCLAIVGGQQLATCSECDGWFTIQAERGRSDKTYCSDACRMRAYRKRKGSLSSGNKRKGKK